jgi:hypothetical protein
MAFAGLEGHFEAKRKESQQKANKNKELHGTPDARLKLNKTGVTIDANNGAAKIALETSSDRIDINTKGAINIASQVDVTISATDEVFFQTKGTKWKKGYIKHANFEVMQ